MNTNNDNDKMIDKIMNDFYRVAKQKTEYEVYFVLNKQKLEFALLDANFGIVEKNEQGLAVLTHLHEYIKSWIASEEGAQFPFLKFKKLVYKASKQVRVRHSTLKGERIVIAKSIPF